MEYLQKCITPREKMTEEEIESSIYYADYIRCWSDDDLQQRLRDDYNARQPPRQIIMDHDDFLLSYCMNRCRRRAGSPENHKQPKNGVYDDESFMMFHFRVLFCLE